MPYRYGVLHPTAQIIYLLSLEYGRQCHPLGVAFWAELGCGQGDGPEMLAEIYEIVNERRAEAGLPPLDPATHNPETTPR